MNMQVNQSSAKPGQIDMPNVEPMISFKPAPAVRKAIDEITENNYRKPEEALSFFLKDIPQGVVKRAQENGDFLSTATLSDHEKLNHTAEASAQALKTDEDFQKTASIAAAAILKAQALDVLTNPSQKSEEAEPLPLNLYAASKISTVLPTLSDEKILEDFTAEEKKLLLDREKFAQESASGAPSDLMKEIAKKVANAIGKAAAMNYALDLYEIRPQKSATEQTINGEKNASMQKKIETTAKADEQPDISDTKNIAEANPRGFGGSDDFERDDLGFLAR